MFKAAATATAASAAFPPSLRILWPASAASGWVHATIPFVLWTTLLRLGKEINGGSSEGNIALGPSVMATDTNVQRLGIGVSQSSYMGISNAD